MDYSVVDIKLPSVIKTCMLSGNRKKVAVVSMALVSNIIDDICINLGFRERNKISNESISEYMKVINTVLNDNFKFILFDTELITNMRLVESQFIKKKGDIPFDYSKELVDIFYELRKLDIPNAYKNIDNDYQSAHSGLHTLYSSSQGKKRKNSTDRFKSLYLHQLKEEEGIVQKELNKKYDRKLFEKIIYLRNVGNSIKIENKNKTEIKGNLKDNIIYQETLEDLLGYFFIGGFILFFLLGLIIGIEAIIHPSLAGSLSILLLVSFSTSVLFFVLYWNYFWRQER